MNMIHVLFMHDFVVVRITPLAIPSFGTQAMKFQILLQGWMVIANL